MGEVSQDGIPVSRRFFEHWMERALAEAEKAYKLGEVPTGCVIVELPPDDMFDPSIARVLGRAHNQAETLKDPTAHAEMLAITQAANARGDWRLDNAALIVTKEPCPMCAGAIALSRIPVVAYGLADPKRGGISAFDILKSDALVHKSALVPDVLRDKCAEMFKRFFKEARAGQRPKPGQPPCCGDC